MLFLEKDCQSARKHEDEDQQKFVGNLLTIDQSRAFEIQTIQEPSGIEEKIFGYCKHITNPKNVGTHAVSRIQYRMRHAHSKAMEMVYLTILTPLQHRKSAQIILKLR
ncbi:hypothetical protein ACH5RR_025955 [Cinchona calisaya]|uniref:Uncharacterized protein n=1 Tax=Cinchona calisaya TaxID=153742 RepID=A0ABD2Z144_9GENT